MPTRRVLQIIESICAPYKALRTYPSSPASALVQTAVYDIMYILSGSATAFSFPFVPVYLMLALVLPIRRGRGTGTIHSATTIRGGNVAAMQPYVQRSAVTRRNPRC